MNTEERKGRVATTEELFDLAFDIADTAEKSLGEAAAVRNEVVRSMARIEKSHTELLDKVEVQAKELKRAYAPEQVQETASAAQATIGQFEKDASRAFVGFEATLKRITRGFRWQTAGTLVIAAVIAFSISFAAPSLNEIQSRRSEVQRLAEEVSNLSAREQQLNSQLQSWAAGRLLTINGHYWIRVDATPQRQCAKTASGETCGYYTLLR